MGYLKRFLLIVAGLGVSYFLGTQLLLDGSSAKSMVFAVAAITLGIACSKLDRHISEEEKRKKK